MSAAAASRGRCAAFNITPMPLKKLNLFCALLLAVIAFGQKTTYKNCKSANIEISYKCFIGKPLDEIVQQLGFDTTKMRLIEEPPAVLRGIGITIGFIYDLFLYRWAITDR
jgi:hypothetical protein